MLLFSELRQALVPSCSGTRVLVDEHEVAELPQELDQRGDVDEAAGR